jgi:Glycosyltransferase
MNILYDFQTYNNRFGGIARYHYELANGLKNIGEKSEISTLFTQSEYLLKDEKYKVYNPLGYNKFKGRYRIGKYIEKINKCYSIERIRKNKFDIFHPTYYNPYFLEYLTKPFVVTVHDFVHEKFDPLRVQDIANKKLLIEKSNKIIAVSENTKRDILEYYDIPENKIQVIYHGVHKVKTNYLENPYGDYILYVGDRYGYKNFMFFLEAIYHLLNVNKNLNLVCTGCPFSDEEINQLRSYKISNQVFQKAANELELRSLYKHALVFVSPSLYEGFGIPILEAFSNDCPICISNSSSFPEIAQDAAIYFNPLSFDSIISAVESVIKNKGLRNKLVEMGQKRVKDFSWERTVKETKSLYSEIV